VGLVAAHQRSAFSDLHQRLDLPHSAPSLTGAHRHHASAQVYEGGQKAALTVVEKKYVKNFESGPSEGNRFIGNADL
jgi:hypothetical protein